MSIFRHEYKALTDADKADMKAIKDRALDFFNELVRIGGAEPDGRMKSRELSLAVTKIEEAVMWAVKHVTR